MKTYFACVVMFMHLVSGDPTSRTDQVKPEDVKTTEAPKNAMGHCLFGDLPSAPCTFTCLMKGSSPFCGDKGLCFCSSEQDDKPDQKLQPVSTPPPPADLSDVKQQQDDSSKGDDLQEGTGHVTMFFFDLGSLFGNDNVTADGSKTPESSAESHSLASVWSLPHMLAALILMMLTVLVTLEVRSCCVQRSKKQLAVQSVLYPPENEKVRLG